MDPPYQTPSNTRSNQSTKDLTPWSRRGARSAAPAKPRNELAELARDIDGMTAITRSVPSDPWGRPYLFEPGRHEFFELHSAGPDGIDGTDDDLDRRRSF